MKTVAAATIAGLLLLFSGTAWQIRRSMQPAAPSAPERVFVVPEGSTLSGVARDLEEAGLLGRLRQMGYAKLKVLLDLTDPMGHTLTIGAGEAEPRTILEMKLRVNRRLLPGRTLLSVEWLLIQDTRTSFELSRPLLPGQIMSMSPSLSMSRKRDTRSWLRFGVSAPPRRLLFST